MKLVSVNVGQPRRVEWRGKTVETAIFKEPVQGAVAVRGHQLDGDRQADPSVHGGPDKAVYGYPSEHYPAWCEWLGVDALPWGAFGENLTTEGLLESDVCIGDRFAVGTTLLEVSEPRIPCPKLGLRHQRPDLPKELVRRGHCGFYFRVVEEGALCAGDALERKARGDELTVAELAGYMRGEGGQELIRRAADHPALGRAWRDELRRRLQTA